MSFTTSRNYRNLASHKAETRQLENEAKNMEERLYELKMAMQRERTNREKHGGGFWKAGQEGSLGSITKIKDLLDKNPNAPKSVKPTKTRKVKVLKDEPTVLPSKPKVPGTMAKIADRDTSGRNTHAKGAKCGQCEEALAHVSCVECGENYCAGCFASFHMRGALKKHRSMPVGARARINMGSAPPVESQQKEDGYVPVADKNPMKITMTDIDVSLVRETNKHGAPMQSRSDASGATSSSLLDGAYNEEESSASFQDALTEWRRGGDSGQQGGSSTSTTAKSAPNATATHVMGTQCGSSAAADTRPASDVAIMFSPSTLTYAEKLMLKKHRRNQLLTSTSGCGGGVAAAATQDTTADDVETLISTPRADSPDLHLHIKRTDTQRNIMRPASQLSIVEIDIDNKQSTSLTAEDYDVEEGPDLSDFPREAFQTPTPHSVRMLSARTGRKSTEPERCATQAKQMAAVKTPRSTANATPRRTSSRTQSRAKSRATITPRAPSRTSYTGSEGLLTKAASASLQAVCSRDTRGRQDDRAMSPGVTGLNQFFALGTIDLQPVQQQPPANERPNSRLTSARTEKYRLNNKLYHMSPCSWRPEASITAPVQDATVPSEMIDTYNQYNNPAAVAEVTITDAYTGQPGNYGAESITTPRTDTRPGPTSRTNMRETKEGTVIEFRLSDTLPVADDDDDDRDGLGAARPGSSLAGPHTEYPPIRTNTPRPLTPRPLDEPPVTTSTGAPRPKHHRHTAPHGAASRPSSAIVIDGDDLTQYDNLSDTEREQELEDQQSLCQLEYELAEEQGRITADGRISRVEVDGASTKDEPPSQSYPSADYQIRESILMDDFDEMEQLMTDQDAVQNLS